MIKKSGLKPCLLLIFILFVTVVMTVGDAFALWYSSNWGFRQKITIDESMISDNGPLSGFPVLIQLSSADSNPVFANARSDGHDILFTQADGTTLLSNEIEQYNSITEDMDMWVRIPSLSDTTDTVIYMYYGNPGASADPSTASTWNSGFVGVWHLSEDPSGIPPQMQESTVNNNDGTSVGGMTSGDQVAGQVDGSLDFDGSPDNVPLFYVESPDSASLNITGDITVSAWIKPTGGSVTQQGISNKRGTVGSGWWLFYENGVTPPGFNCGTDLIHWKSNGGVCSSSTIPRNQWTHVVGTLDSSDRKIYINGQEDASSGSGGSIGDSSGIVHSIGRGTGFDGQIDELRISDIVRSPDWIEASFNNQDNPSSFLSFDAQEIFVPAPTMTEWGMIIFMVFAGLVSVYYLRRKGIV